MLDQGDYMFSSKESLGMDTTPHSTLQTPTPNYIPPRYRERSRQHERAKQATSAEGPKHQGHANFMKIVPPRDSIKTTYKPVARAVHK